MEKDFSQAHPLWELLLIEAIAFGYFTLSSIGYVLNFSGSTSITVNDAAMIATAVHELFFFLIAFWVLKVRGWKLTDFGLTVNWPLTLRGIQLWAGNYFLYFILGSRKKVLSQKAP